MELVVQARATDGRLLGGDMPAALQRLTGLAPEPLDRARELHCMFALRDAAPSGEPLRAALFWGDAHTSREGLPRLVAAEAQLLIVHLVGGRPNPLVEDARLSHRLAVTAPVLIPTTADELALVLPGPHLKASVERSRDPLAAAGTEVELRVRSERAGTLLIGEHRVEVRPSAPVILALSPSDRTFIFRSTELMMVGALELGSHGAIELELRSTTRQVRLLYLSH